MSRRRIAVLISGRGSNMQALVAGTRAPDCPFEVGLIVCNRPAAAGLGWAKEHGLPTRLIDHKGYPSREAFDRDVHTALVDARIDLIALAGFMRIQSDWFVTEWLGRQVNIHPSLLPAFKGLHPHRQALDAGVRISGCTVHFVTPELDGGPIIAQAAVAVEPGDTEDSLAARILAIEHKLYPAALGLLARGQARLVSGRAELAGRPVPATAFGSSGLSRI